MQRKTTLSDAIFTELTNLGHQQSQETTESKRAILASLAFIEHTQRHLARSANTNQLTLEDLKGKVTDLIQLESTSDISYLEKHPCKQKKANASNSTKQAMYMRYLSWRLPIGYVVLGHVRNSAMSVEGKSRRGKEKESYACSYAFTFIAPSWLSTSIFKISLQAQSQHGPTNWNRNLSFGMQNYNPDPRLRICVEKDDIIGLRQMFDDGRARSTDYLPDGRPILMVS